MSRDVGDVPEHPMAGSSCREAGDDEDEEKEDEELVRVDMGPSRRGSITQLSGWLNSPTSRSRSCLSAM